MVIQIISMNKQPDINLKIRLFLSAFYLKSIIDTFLHINQKFNFIFVKNLNLIFMNTILF